MRKPKQKVWQIELKIVRWQFLNLILPYLENQNTKLISQIEKAFSTINNLSFVVGKIRENQ